MNETLVRQTTAERRVETVERTLRNLKLPLETLSLAYYAALPVALNSELLHLLRVNFFPDLPYTAEAVLLLSSLCQEIGDDLYEIEPAVRDYLLQNLVDKHEPKRIRQIAALLWQYTQDRMPWRDLVLLERAQQLTAVNLLDPEAALAWIESPETKAYIEAAPGERNWFVAMQAEVKQREKITEQLHKRMGAIPHPGGTIFRVWAPHANRVSVVGNFNRWNRTAHPLKPEADGCWTIDVPNTSPGDEYRYVISNGDKEMFRIDPYAQEVTNSAGNAIIYNRDFDWGASHRPPPWNEWVIYEMHIGTFNDTARSGPGTFDDIVPKLPYLADLGINAIEIMPVHQFPTDHGWGYNPADLFAVHSSLGGPKGLQRLVKAAHANGIAVIVDVVYNHFGPGDLDLWRFDGWFDANHDGGIYFYDDSRAHASTPWGNTRPDYGRPEVRQYIGDNALMWLEQYQVDGLRWDATAVIRNVSGQDNDPANDLPEGWSLMQDINNDIKSRYPQKISIAEDTGNNTRITQATHQGGAGFDAQWAPRFVRSIRAAVIASDDSARDMAAVRDAISHRYNADAFERVIYTESHDDVANGHKRVPEEIWAGNAGSWYSRKRSTLGAALVFTAPGIPMIFQGQEFLEDGYFRDVDPLDWSKLDTYAGIHTLYRDLIRLRRNWSSQTRGLCGQHINVHHVNNADKLIAFHRWENGGPGDDVIVVANFANRSHNSYTIGMPRAGSWRVRFNSDSQEYSTDFTNYLGYDTTAGDGARDGMPFQADVGVGSYSVLILSQDIAR